jgi:hypothetical protein
MIDIEKLKNCLSQLADLEYQRAAWLSAEGPVVSSFSELVSQAFDDTGLSKEINQDEAPGELNRETFAALKRLDRAVSQVDQSQSPEALLEDPCVENVRKLARRALDLM